MDCKYITPSVTIFKADGTVDLEAMERHFDFLIQGGVDGILILGSIGEFFSMPCVLYCLYFLITCALHR